MVVSDDNVELILLNHIDIVITAEGILIGIC